MKGRIGQGQNMGGKMTKEEKEFLESYRMHHRPNLTQDDEKLLDILYSEFDPEFGASIEIGWMDSVDNCPVTISVPDAWLKESAK